MEIIALFFPTIITIKLLVIRKHIDKDEYSKMIINFGIYTLLNNIVTQMIITYLIGIPEVNSDAFHSFSFFMKYCIIAILVALLFPFVVELVKKYIKITVETGVERENEKDKNAV